MDRATKEMEILKNLGNGRTPLCELAKDEEAEEIVVGLSNGPSHYFISSRADEVSDNSSGNGGKGK